MKKSISRSLAAVFAFLLFVSVMSSCNKGYGCPGELSVSPIVQLF